MTKVVHDMPGTYVTSMRNCVDVALGAAAEAGITITTRKHFIFCGRGHNCGDLGEDLK